MMETISQRLEYVLKTAKVTQIELAKKLGIKQQAISRVCTGYTKNSKLIVPICQELSANPTWVLSGDGEPFYSVATKKSTLELPLISWSQALKWDTLQKRFNRNEVEEWWAVSAKIASESGYVLRVRGDAMESTGNRNVPEGAVIVVEPNTHYQSGDLVIAQLPQTTEATFKQIIVEGNQTYLKSFNSQYPLIPFGKDAKVVGIVKQAVIQFC